MTLDNQLENDVKEIKHILGRVQSSVHALDYEAVRDLIPEDGLYFGSVAAVARGYDELYEQQFTRVWPNISEFTIPDESITVRVSRPLAAATCLFESTARAPDGKQFERKGRMTFVFELRDDKWIMVHSHDSLYPVMSGQ